MTGELVSSKENIASIQSPDVEIRDAWRLMPATAGISLITGFAAMLRLHPPVNHQNALSRRADSALWKKLCQDLLLSRAGNEFGMPKLASAAG